METLLIADDEKNIRDGLKCILDWEALGFTVCGEASNGEEALSGILKSNPSLVLLDIRMPKLTGIDIIRIAREQGYDGRFIILSGYSDFSYAQAAIRYGVEYYLTKPIDEDELLDAINSIRKNIEQEHQQSDNIALYREKAKDVILHELVTGVWKKDGSTGLPSADFQGMELTSDIYQVVIYEKFDASPDNPDYDFADLLNITNSQNHSFEHFEEDHKNVVLLKGSFALRRFEEFLNRYEKTDYPAESPMDTLFLTYGHPVKNLDEICLSYDEAHTLIRRRFFCIQGQHSLGYEELPAMTSHSLLINDEKLREYCSALTNYLQANNRKQVAATFFSLEEYLYNVNSSIEAVRLFLTDLFLQLKEAVGKLPNSSRISFPSNSAIIDHIDNCHYLYEIILYISGQSNPSWTAVTTHRETPFSMTFSTILTTITRTILSSRPSHLFSDTTAPISASSSQRQSARTSTPTSTTGALSIPKSSSNRRVSKSTRYQNRSDTRMWTTFTRNSKNMSASARQSTANN